MATVGIKCISRPVKLIDWPVGSCLLCISKENKPSQSYLVLYNVSKCNFVCYSDKCERFNASNIYSHTISSAYYLEAFGRYIELVSRSCSKTLLSNIVSLTHERNAGKQKPKSTQEHKGRANARFHVKQKSLSMQFTNLPHQYFRIHHQIDILCNFIESCTPKCL